MTKRCGGLLLLVSLLVLPLGMQAASLAELSYPELIVYNGKVVTVDNADFTTNIGTIAQAMAVRGGKILAVGTNAEVQALAGPQTKRIDLKGRTVLPGFMSTHEHPADWAPISPRAFGKVVTDNEMVARYLDGTPQEQLAQVQPTLVELIRKAKPGQWVRVYMFRGKLKSYSGDLCQGLPRVATKGILDGLAPNNPVEVKAGTCAVYNAKAIQEILADDPKLSFIYDAADKIALQERGLGSIDVYRHVESAVMYKGRLPLLAGTYKKELEYWPSLGLTTLASAAYDSVSLRGWRYLDERGEMPMRMAWGYVGPNFSPDILDYLASIQGHGTDTMWFVGSWVTALGSCTTINARPEVKQQEECVVAPGMQAYIDMYNIIKSGLRVATMHTGGDKDIDYYLDIIEKASKDAGLTADQIRAKRHTFDHSGLAPRPQQYERLKRLGVMVSINSIYHYTSLPRVAANYGEEYTAWVGPRKSLSDYGIMNSFETDTPLSQEDSTLFEIAWYSLTRKARDGKVYSPSEKIDRERMLKSMTTWGSYYVIRENLLGSLEPGKFADFIVIDRDYLTIPEDEIPKIKVLGTLVGGKFVYTDAGFASEIGVTPVGYQGS